MPCTTYLPLLLLLLLFLLPPSLESKVIIKGNQTILSFKAIFRLGFFSTTNGSSNWYLGISYASMPTPTHVWVANRIRPVSDPDSSTLELTSTGYLIVSNLRDGVVWQTDNKQPGTDFRFSETGNLILINDDGSPVWQSFDNPTDTWLPGMNVTGLTAMTSWRSLFDPSPGFYSLRLSPSFNEFQLVYKGTTPYWSTGNWTGEAFVGVPEMTIPYIYRFHFVNPYTPTASFWYIVPPLDSVSEPRLTRFMVGANGQLKQYTWDPQTQSWNMFWLQPEDPCRVYNLCGQLGFCSSELLKPCACIRGFRPRNDAAWRSDDYSDGCRRENGDSGEKSDTFEAVGDLRYDGDVKMSRLQVSKSSCAKTCLGNSSCVGFYHKEKSNLCKILLESPNNLKNSSSWTGVSEDVLYIREPKKGNSKGNISKSIIILCSVVGSISVLGFTLLVPLILLKRSRKRKKTRKQDEDGDTLGEKETEPEKWFFPPWAAREIIQGNVDSVVDSRLNGEYNTEEVTRMATVAIWCIQDNEEIRPAMGTVVKMLEGVVEVTVPPPPKLIQALVSGDSYRGVSGTSCSEGHGCSDLNTGLSSPGSRSSFGRPSP
ncbi:unnamed protein product [Arabidopsis thaliana]|uniref:non-specific serine/threonine protein kinase n=1 Tax=Arabidopsis thaliana TaxID=3702 RepID=A0A7G2EV06_ARATH|nr:unnamed protein product [Arabidopsis thaliana]